MPTPDQTESDSDPRERKPRLNFQVEPEDERAILALLPLVPAFKSGNIKRSVVERALIRLGLDALANDPSIAADVETPDVADLTARASGAKRLADVARERDEAIIAKEKAEIRSARAEGKRKGKPPEK